MNPRTDQPPLFTDDTTPGFEDRQRLAEDIARYETGEHPGYTYFYGGKETSKTASYSNWFFSPFTIDDITYRTLEHWLMAQKARLFKDFDAATKIVTAKHPRKAKQLGRAVTGFDETTWAENRYRIAVEGMTAKFTQNPPLGSKLLGSGPTVIVEASPTDRIWGIGLTAGHPDRTDPRLWKGLNICGFALTETRDLLR